MSTTPEMPAGKKYPRKCLAHFIHNGTAYQKIGKHLKGLTIEMNATEDSFTNIWGESTSEVTEYAPEYSVDTFYAVKGDALCTWLENIINTRATGSEVETSVVEVKFDTEGNIEWAYKEDAIIVIQSYGGENNINVPFKVKYNGNRVAIPTENVQITDGVLTISESEDDEDDEDN